MRRRHAVLLALLLPALAACQAPSGQAGRQGRQMPVPVVFFTEDSAFLGEQARATIAEAAELARERPNAPVTVLGFTAPPGSAGFNRALSEARARNVADALVAAGVPAGRISVRPRGPVPFEMMPTESRRVEIRVGG